MSDLAEVEAFVAASAKVLDLPLPPGLFAGVVANTSILLAHAACVMAFRVPPAGQADVQP